jgi:predicted ATP-dependent endonuclease of OLD family
MSIVKVHIKNCKSIEDINLSFNKKMNCFIGTNNVGKTNIMKSIDFFIKI